MDDDDDHKVGFGKPPVATRFKKGQSGNPRGRPKRDPPPEEDPGIPETFRRIINEKVRVNGPDGPRYITKLEASVIQMVNKAAAGDFKALRAILHILDKFPQLINDDSVKGFEIHFVKSPHRQKEEEEEKRNKEEEDKK